jgi:hypothetical protein
MLRGKITAGRNFYALRLSCSQKFDVGSTDVNDEYVHSWSAWVVLGLMKSMGRVALGFRFLKIVHPFSLPNKILWF